MRSPFAAASLLLLVTVQLPMLAPDAQGVSVPNLEGVSAAADDGGQCSPVSALWSPLCKPVIDCRQKVEAATVNRALENRMTFGASKHRIECTGQRPNLADEDRFPEPPVVTMHTLTSVSYCHPDPVSNCFIIDGTVWEAYDEHAPGSGHNDAFEDVVDAACEVKICAIDTFDYEQAVEGTWFCYEPCRYSGWFLFWGQTWVAVDAAEGWKLTGEGCVPDESRADLTAMWCKSAVLLYSLGDPEPQVEPVKRAVDDNVKPEAHPPECEETMARPACPPNLADTLEENAIQIRSG